MPAASSVATDTATGDFSSFVKLSSRAAVLTVSPSAVTNGAFAGPIFPTIARPV
jgi:hypothetical protein